MKEKIKCNNPDPSAEYGRDEFDDIHMYCENCGEEVISVKLKGEKKFHWIHGRIGRKIIPV